MIDIFRIKFNKYIFVSIFFVGVGLIGRKMAASASVTVSLTKEADGTHIFKTESAVKSTNLKFKLGEEFVEETMDGRKVNTTITFDGNTMTQKQLGDKATTIVREFTDTECICTMILGDVTCVRKYTAI